MKRMISIVLTLVLCFSLAVVPSVSAAAVGAPGKIIGLKITTAGKQKQLKLSWKQQPQVGGYQVYRSLTGKSGSYQRVATLRGAGKNRCTDTGLKASTTYYYGVRAFSKLNGTIVYGKFAKTNLSTRLTKAAIQKKLVAANRFYIDWVLHCYEAWKYADTRDTKPIPGEKSEWMYYIRVKSNKYHSVADLKKEAAKYFTKAVYEEHIDGTYADINGKLYIKSYDAGGDGGIGKGTLKVLAVTDTACKFRVTEREPESTYVYTDDYKLVYQNGRWLFRNMTDSFSIYYQGNRFWQS